MVEDTETQSDLASVKILAGLPHGRFTPTDGIRELQNLIGAKIVNIGTPDADLEGGGFAIEFIETVSGRKYRIVFGLCEQGMWIEYFGPAG